MSLKSIRAFSDPQYDYYKLTKDFGLLKKARYFIMTIMTKNMVALRDV